VDPINADKPSMKLALVLESKNFPQIDGRSKLNAANRGLAPETILWMFTDRAYGLHQD
jgi:hypothetical protein